MRIKNLLQYLEMTATRLPDRTAISDGQDGASLTFEELLDCARRIGSALCRAEATGKRVAVLMDRHPMTVAVMLGAVYAGACYVPLDGSMPTARVQHILAQSQATLMVCDRTNCAVGESYGLPVLVDEQLCGGSIDSAVLAKVRDAQIDTDPLYIIFTSGSTGTPKGVIGCHRAVIDYGEALTAALGFDEACVFGCQSPLYFDAPFKELLTTLMCGATTYLIPRRLFSFPVLLLQYLKQHQINTICWVSSALSAVAALGALESDPPKTLQTVVFGSEVFPLPHYRRWREALPQACFWQLYGPTEATGMSCYFYADRDFADGERIPIGRPLDNTGVFLLNENGEEVCPEEGKRSEQGEIYLRGSCLTLGYDHDDVRTAERFVQNPLQRAYPETVYRTGDMAYYNERGELVFWGRKDGQFKRMGHRVEPGEIEAAALRCDGVMRAACGVRASDTDFVLFYTGEFNDTVVMQALRQYLPRPLLPRAVRHLDELPLTDNGKIDRRALSRLAEEDELWNEKS